MILLEFTYTNPVLAEVILYVSAFTIGPMVTKAMWMGLKVLGRGIRWVYEVYVYGL